MRHRWLLATCCVGAVFLCAASPAISEDCSEGFTVRDLQGMAKRARGGTQRGFEPANPIVARLVRSTAKSLACVELINYFASKDKEPSKVVSRSNVATANGVVAELSNALHHNVCGSINYANPQDLPGYLARIESDGVESDVGHMLVRENGAYKKTVQSVIDAFVNTEGELAAEMSNVVQPYLPSGSEYSAPSNKYLSEVLVSFESDISAGFGKVRRDEAFDEPTADAFVDACGCAPVLPVASGPDEAQLMNYPSAFGAYKKLLPLIDAATGQ
jgi:hypothetical protein